DQGGRHDQAARGAGPVRPGVHPLRSRDHASGEGRSRDGTRMIRTAAFAGVLVLWGLVAYGNRALALMNPVLLPTPGEVVAVAAPQIRDGSLARHLAVSSLRIVEGFGLAAAAALGLGLLVAVWVPARLALEPMIEFVRPIPPLAFLPMFLVWFGLGETSKVAFIAYTTFFGRVIGFVSYRGVLPRLGGRDTGARRGSRRRRCRIGMSVAQGDRRDGRPRRHGHPL